MKHGVVDPKTRRTSTSNTPWYAVAHAVGENDPGGPHPATAFPIGRSACGCSDDVQAGFLPRGKVRNSAEGEGGGKPPIQAYGF